MASPVQKYLATSVFAFGLLGLSQAANATVIVSAAVGGAPTGVEYVNFDDLTLGNAGGATGGVIVSYTGDAKTVTGAVGGEYAAPYISNGNGALFGAADGADTTPYLTTGLGTVTIKLPFLSKYIGLLWGSVDNYNTLSLYDGATLVGSVGGTDVWAGANGDQGVNGTFYVNLNSDIGFDTVVASSTQYAFEFDNVAFNAERIIENQHPVPEPASLALFGAGLAGMACVRRRRRV